MFITRFASILFLTLAVASCSVHGTVSPVSSGSPSLTAPSPTPAPAAPLGSYTLSGVVFEVTATGETPVEGVQVYCDACGSPDGHTFTQTDTNGFYTFSWARNGNTPLLVQKAGYTVIDPIRTFSDGWGEKDATVNGDTRFDIQLVRR